MAYDEKKAALIREHERLHATLDAIRTYAASCTFGGWRYVICKMIDNDTKRTA